MKNTYQTLKDKEIVSELLKRNPNVKKADIENFLTSYYDIVRIALENGYRIRMKNIGSFSFKRVKATEERDMKFGMTGEMIHVEAKPAHDRPIFKFSIALSKAIKHNTEQNE